MSQQKVIPFLWFDTQAEEAARFYVSLVPNSSIDTIVPGPTGSAFVVGFTLDGVRYTALNGGPTFKHTEAFSLVINCADQAEVDRYWDTLCEGGSPSQCGWLKDRYGIFWQVVPTALPRLMNDPDPAKRSRVMQAMMQMTKIDVAKLEAAGSN